VRRLASLPNTVCKLSGLVTEADRGQWSVEDLCPYVAPRWMLSDRGG
jgi:predicted TIM-barrel fold metal-dependent hydrolase